KCGIARETRPVNGPKHEVVLAPTGDDLRTGCLQQAIDACGARGGGRVVLRPGRYRTGTLVMRSGVTLHLEKDAVLVASGDIGDYLRKQPVSGAHPYRAIPTAMLFAEDTEDIALTGEGTIDGNGEAFYRDRTPSDPPPPDWVEPKKALGTWIPAFHTLMTQRERPRAEILFINCRKVRIENVRIRNSPQWTLFLLACADVVVRGIDLHSPVNCPNGDGIDVDGCSDVLVEDCDITTGDDAVCLKNTNTWGLARTSRNVTVRRCRLRATAHAFCIGTETQADFENVVLADLEIAPYDGYGLTGIGLSILEGAAIRGVRVSNIRIADINMPLYVRLGAECHGVPKPLGAIEDIVFENLTARGVTGNSFLTGQPGHPLRNIALRNIRIEFAGVIDPDKVMREVPLLETEYAVNTIWRFLPSYGLFCRLVDGLRMSDVRITGPATEKRPAVVLKNVQGFSSQNFSVTE
ncbi:MAG TPA: glycosyl hydrolase family 28 protein, partial [Phycisphaerae bacterium]|nr:glycosyl hydrolase family 28 protein [Phycisphaerae bacterium]